MLDDFFTRALLAGIGLALVAGPLGCFVVWRKMAYFGDTLAHAALLGVALSLLANLPVMLAVLIVAMVVACLLLLGMLSHGSLAIGLLALAFMTWVRMDMMGLLFGDVLAVTKQDIALIWLGGAGILAALTWAWKPLFAITVNRDLAAAEGHDVLRHDLLLMLLLAIVVAVAIKIVGVMLITSLLIIPAGAARRLSPGPVAMAVLAASAGVVAVVAGLFASLQWNTPSGPSIVAAALLLFILGLILPMQRLQEGHRP